MQVIDELQQGNSRQKAPRSIELREAGGSTQAQIHA